MNTKRDQTILEMCKSYRSDYDLKKLPTDPPWVLGLTDTERKGLWRTMAHIYDTELEAKINHETKTVRQPKNRHQRKMGKR